MRRQSFSGIQRNPQISSDEQREKTRAIAAEREKTRAIAAERDVQYYKYANLGEKGKDIAIQTNDSPTKFSDEYQLSEFDVMQAGLESPHDEETYSKSIEFYCNVYEFPDDVAVEFSNNVFQKFLKNAICFKITFKLQEGRRLVVRKFGVKRMPIVALTLWNEDGSIFSYNTRLILNLLDKELEQFNKLISTSVGNCVTQIESQPYTKINEYVNSKKEERARTFATKRHNFIRSSSKKGHSNKGSSNKGSSFRGRSASRGRRDSVTSSKGNPALNDIDSLNSDNPFARSSSSGNHNWVLQSQGADSRRPMNQASSLPSAEVQLSELVAQLRALTMKNEPIPPQAITALLNQLNH